MVAGELDAHGPQVHCVRSRQAVNHAKNVTELTASQSSFDQDRLNTALVRFAVARQISEAARQWQVPMRR